MIDCDRVVYCAQKDVTVLPIAYDAVTTLRTSDHRPVYAVFHIEAPLAPHPFAAQPHAFQLLFYDLVLRVRSPADVLRAASGAPPTPPTRSLSLRLVSRHTADKVSRIAVAPTVRAPLHLHAHSHPPRYQPPSSCVALGPFVALDRWCVEGAHVVLLIEAKDDIVGQCALPLTARFAVAPPTGFALQLTKGGVVVGELGGQLHVVSDDL